MALTSPRFANVEQLARAATNSPWLSTGMRGHGVHLVQFALIDLGFPMPGSTGGKGMSPDGIYGSETKKKVEEFQKSTLGGPPITDDGCVGANTMAKLERAIGGYTHTIPVSIWTARPSAMSVFSMVRVAKEVFGHYGLKFDVTWGKSVALSNADHDKLRKQGEPLSDLVDLVKKKMGATFGAKTTVVVQLGRFDPDDVYGIAKSDGTSALVRISDDATESTLGHEVGHILLTPISGPDIEDHSAHQSNLMGTGTRIAPYVLNLAQVREMRGHPRSI